MSVPAECYGKMFPSTFSVERNREIRGKVFRCRVNVPGMAVTSREVGFDQEAWEGCMACPDFEGCYRVSTGVLLLEKAVM